MSEYGPGTIVVTVRHTHAGIPKGRVGVVGWPARRRVVYVLWKDYGQGVASPVQMADIKAYEAAEEAA